MLFLEVPAITINFLQEGEDGTVDNLTVDGNLTVNGSTTEIDEQITDQITLEDDSNVTQMVLDGDAAPAFIRINDGNELRFGSDNDRQLVWDDSNTNFDLKGGDIRFAGITGTPTFGNHDHSEGGTATVPNSGLTNSSITVTAGGGLATNGDGTLNLGDSETYSVNTGNGLEVSGDNVAISTNGIQTDELDLSITPTWTGIHNFEAGIGFGTDSGALTALDMTVSSTPSVGTEESLALAVDGTNFMKLYAEADGSGGVQSEQIEVDKRMDINGNILVTGDGNYIGFGASEPDNRILWNDSQGRAELRTTGRGFEGWAVWDTDASNLLQEWTEGGHTKIVDSSTGDTLVDVNPDGNQRTEFPKGVDFSNIISQTASGSNGSYTTSGESVILVDTATNTTAYTVTLASADAVSGRRIRVKDSGGGAGTNSITVDTEGSETIDGQASITLDANFESVELVSDGTDWYVFGRLQGGGVL